MRIGKILLIDDDRDELEMFQEAIHQVDASIEVCQLTTPPESIPKEHESCPDLVFLDINMPRQNGFEVLDAMKEGGCDVPVVMYSTSSNKAQIEKAYAHGASLYLTKPWRFQELVRAVQTILHLDWSTPQTIRSQVQQKGGDSYVFEGS